MLERLSKCPLCKSGLFLNHSEITDYAVSQETFILCRCSSCQLLFTNPRPKQDQIGPYYNFPEYYSHEDKAKNVTQWIYQRVRDYSISTKVKFIGQLAQKGKLLDYGCGTGEFLNAAKVNGWKVSGIEPNDRARRQAHLKLADKAKPSTDERKTAANADVVTLYHVPPHIHALRKTLQTLRNRPGPDD